MYVQLDRLGDSLIRIRWLIGAATLIMHRKTLLTCYCNVQSLLTALIFTRVTLRLTTSDHSERQVAFIPIPAHRMSGPPAHVSDLIIRGANEAVCLFAGTSRIDLLLVDLFGASVPVHVLVNVLLFEFPPVLGFSWQCGAQRQQQNQAGHTHVHDHVWEEKHTRTQIEQIGWTGFLNFIGHSHQRVTEKVFTDRSPSSRSVNRSG